MYNLETDPRSTRRKRRKSPDSKKHLFSGLRKRYSPKTEFNREGKTYELVQFTVAQLGFQKERQRKKYMTRRQKNWVWNSARPKSVPHLRLQYKGADWKLIAMKQITDRYGDPDVFNLVLVARGSARWSRRSTAAGGILTTGLSSFSASLTLEKL